MHVKSWWRVGAAAIVGLIGVWFGAQAESAPAQSPSTGSLPAISRPALRPDRSAGALPAHAYPGAMSPESAATGVWNSHTRGIDPVNGEGGSTYSLHEGNLRGRDLWAVSVFPELSEPVPAKLLNRARVLGFVQKHHRLLTDPRLAVGTWQTGGRVWLDVTAVVRDEATAWRLGRRYNQIGIYHLGGRGFRATGGDGMTKAALPRLGDRLRDLGQWAVASR